MASVLEKLLFPLVIIIIAIAAIWIFITKGADILTAKTTASSNEVVKTPTGSTLVGSDVKYVNPILCTLFGKFCDPNTDSSIGSTKANGQKSTGSIPVIDVPPNYTTAPTAQQLVNKLNSGGIFTNDEIEWARVNEPTLWVLITSR